MGWGSEDGGEGRSAGDCSISQNEKLPQIIFLLSYCPSGKWYDESRQNIISKYITWRDNYWTSWFVTTWARLRDHPGVRASHDGGQVISIRQANMVTQGGEWILQIILTALRAGYGVLCQSLPLIWLYYHHIGDHQVRLRLQRGHQGITYSEYQETNPSLLASSKFQAVEK